MVPRALAVGTSKHFVSQNSGYVTPNSIYVVPKKIILQDRSIKKKGNKRKQEILHRHELLQASLSIQCLMAGFTCFFTIPFLLALVVPLFLRFHLNMGCYVPSGVERSYVSDVCLPFLSVLPSRFVITQLLQATLLQRHHHLAILAGCQRNVAS